MISFKEKVYQAARRIPRGNVATYSQLARLAGKPRAARAVGQLMSHNTDPKDVPCHRVVAVSGSLTGYAFGTGVSTKEKKLRAEGVTFKETAKKSKKGARVDMAVSLWSNQVMRRTKGR